VTDFVVGEFIWLETKIEELNKNDSKFFIENYMRKYNKVIH
jgi:hypothetical protein